MHEGCSCKEENSTIVIMENVKKFINRFVRMTFRSHLAIGLLLRTLLIIYGMIQDELIHVPFTDIDYKVFSDAARYVTAGLSPYNRHTYRYSPLISYLAVPNHYIHPTAGKFIFSFIDILTTILIYKLLQIDGVAKSKRTYYSLFWLYNPLSIVISCRGNSDSLSAFVVLLTLYFYKKKNIVYSGLTHGLSVHLRLYPIIYSIPLYFCLKEVKKFNLWDLVYPTVRRIKLISSCILSFTTLSMFFYYLYGDDFLNESLLFHFKRVDVRHNYSVFFYLQYLNFDLGSSAFHKVCMMNPLLVLLIYFPLHYCSEKDLAFCLMCMSFTFVSYNTVLTCQYFVWYLCLLPVVLPHIRCPTKQSIVLACMWLLAQLTWLIPAYLLEFEFRNTFLLIWIQGMVFFLGNILVLSALIKGYSSKIKSY